MLTTSDIGGHIMVLKISVKHDSTMPMTLGDPGLDLSAAWVVRRVWVMTRQIFDGDDTRLLQVGNAVAADGFLSIALSELDGATDIGIAKPALHSGLGSFLWDTNSPALYSCGNDTNGDRRNILLAWGGTGSLGTTGECDVYIELMRLSATPVVP